MKLLLLNLLFAKIIINNVLGDVETFRLKTELAVDIDDPLYQECSGGVFYFGGQLHF